MRTDKRNYMDNIAQEAEEAANKAEQDTLYYQILVRGKKYMYLQDLKMAGKLLPNQDKKRDGRNIYCRRSIEYGWTS